MSQDRRMSGESVEGFTPGPWNVWRGWQYEGGGEDLCIGAGEAWLANMDHREPRCQQIHDDGHFDECCDVCSIDGPRITTEQLANAHLIAAAPTMYAALKDIATKGGNRGAAELRRIARAALAAALPPISAVPTPDATGEP